MSDRKSLPKSVAWSSARSSDLESNSTGFDTRPGTYVVSLIKTLHTHWLIFVNRLCWLSLPRKNCMGFEINGTYIQKVANTQILRK